MASGLKPVRMNNAVRGEVEAALGSLRLFAPDAAARLDAAEAVFHSHDPAALPALERALSRESDAGVKRRMEQARAAALLFADDSQRGRSAGGDRGAARARRHRQPQPARVAVGPAAGGGPGRRGRGHRRSTAICSSGASCRASITGCRSARCCCWRRRGWRSPSASWA